MADFLLQKHCTGGKFELQLALQIFLMMFINLFGAFNFTIHFYEYTTYLE
jgi:hypothetical protein